MSIEMVCSECSATYRVKDLSAAKKLTCKHCGAVLKVPVAATEPDDRRRSAAIKPLDADELVPAGWAASERSRPAPRSSAVKAPLSEPQVNVGRLVLATFLFVVTVVIGVWLGRLLLDGIRSHSWPSVEGTVVRSLVVGTGKQTRFQFLYRYQVDGMSCEGYRVTIAGNSGLFCGSYSDTASRYPEQARVQVYYKPSDPEVSTLQTGLPTVLGYLIGALMIVGICIALFTWTSYAEAFGPPRSIPDPDLEDPRCVSARALTAMIGVLMMLVGGGGALLMLKLPATLPPFARDAWSWLALTFVAIVLGGVMLVIAWVGWLVFVQAFKRPLTINDMRKAPDSPQFSDSSLICFSAGLLGTPVAIIVDFVNGMIHFKSCFQRKQRGFFSGFTEPWWSCSLDDITGLSQMTVKGHTTFYIATQQGRGQVSTLIDNFTELRECLETRSAERRHRVGGDSVTTPDKSQSTSVKTVYAPGHAPLSLPVAVSILGAVLGPLLGLVIGGLFGSRNVGGSMMWGFLLGVGSGVVCWLRSPRRPKKSDGED